MPTTLRTPFRLEGGRVGLTTDQTTQVQQKIVDVMVTNTLERVAIPDYGGNLGALVFDNVDTLAFQDFKTDMAQEVSASVTGVSVIDIQFDTETDVGYVNVNVIYRLPLSTEKQFTFRLALPGEVNEETPLQ
jgi:phage baseplate assembly protein W